MIESMSSTLLLLLKKCCGPCGELEHDRSLCRGELKQNASICEEPEGVDAGSNSHSCKIKNSA